MADEYNAADAWTGLAAAALSVNDLDTARHATEAALRSAVPGPALQALAETVVQRLGLPGWCGLDSDGLVQAGPRRPSRIELDGVRARTRLPPSWRQARQLTVAGRAGPYLGSPIPIAAITATEGFVEPRDGGLEGWAWHPAEPARMPLIRVRGPRSSLELRAEHAIDLPPGGNPFIRPRRFALAAATVAELGQPIVVTDPNGRNLLGSPLDPSLESRAASGAGRAFQPVWADLIGPPPAARSERSAEVVIPAYRGRAETLACIQSVLASLSSGAAVHVIEDASPEPDLAAALDRLAEAGRIKLTRLPHNHGFPATANIGLDEAGTHDVVLLNSDTLVAPGWLERLRAAAYAAPDTGTATPLSNDATIVSYPDLEGGNPVPDLEATIRLDRLAQRANPGATAELPVGVGFCLYLRRDCLDDVGRFREDLFAQGYGEENDLCLRARHRGWRHVAALDVFVAHCGGRSFGAAREHLIRRNTAILNRLHPGYDAMVAAHIAADPLLPARRAMDALRFAEDRAPNGAALIVTHGGGGGVDQVITDRKEALRRDRVRPVVLRPAPGGCRIDGFPNLRYAVPDELPALASLLRPERPRHLELHHQLGHDSRVLDVARLLGIPIDAWVHDYAAFCPRIALVSRHRRYCGEPDVPGCEDCIADLGSLLEQEIPVRDLLARSAREFAACRRVVAPSQDAAIRLRRHFPGVAPEIRPWEADADLPPPSPAPAAAVTRVCVVGAIGIEKGFEVLLGCVRDAGRRGLPLEFAVCGYTSDDERLLAAGPVFVTGEFKEEEAVSLIRGQGAHLAFLPSVFPETWCLALTRAWRAGLNVAAFDLGAQAERIAATGRGWTLPLGLTPAGVNDVLLRLAPPSAPSQSPRRTRNRSREC